jgi:hypothetical protein
MGGTHLSNGHRFPIPSSIHRQTWAGISDTYVPPMFLKVKRPEGFLL